MKWGCEAAASKSAARSTLEERGSQLTAAAQRLWLVRPAPATFTGSILLSHVGCLTQLGTRLAISGLMLGNRVAAQHLACEER